MYFLAIVADEDVKNGNFVPSYVLCKSCGTSQNRSPWRVYREDLARNVPRVLVRSMNGKEQMIDFLSQYRTRDHMHGLKRYDHLLTKKYHPKGALCWFECNEYGEQTGPAVFIKRVPDERIVGNDGGFQRLKKTLLTQPTLCDIFSRATDFMPLVFSGVKPKLHQTIRRPYKGD